MQVKDAISNILKQTAKILLNIIRWILGLFFIFGTLAEAFTLVLFIKPFDWQVGLCVIFSLILTIYSLIVFFFRTKLAVKIIYIILLFSYPYLSNSIPAIVKYENEDACTDVGICAEGVKWGKDIITKDFCLKNNWKWDEKRKSCNVREKTK